MFILATRFTWLGFIITFKMANGINEQNPTTCIPKMHGCPTVINVNWWESPPYIYKDNNEIKGVLKGVIEILVRECCGKCVTFNFAEQSNEFRNILTRNRSAVHVPIYGTTTSERYESYPYFPVVEPPGSIYFQQRIAPRSSKAVMKSVISGWPVLALTCIMAMLSGIIMWALDSYHNPQFHGSFFRGSWEGCWWAFVTMTTVGYGDKVPVSLCARIFAFLWVLFGLVIISIFTATISTSLTSLCLRNNVELFGKTIVVLNGSEEERYVQSNNAIVEPVANIYEFINKSLNSGSNQIDGGLLDSYVAGFYEKLLQQLKFEKVFENNQYTYGFIVSDELDNGNIPNCLRRKLSSFENIIDKMVLNNLHVIPEGESNPALEKSMNLFDGHGTLFNQSIYVCLGASAFLLLCGIAWEYFYYKPKQKAKELKVNKVEKVVTENTSYKELFRSQCEEIEGVMANSVDDFYIAFQKRIQSIGSLMPTKQYIADTSNI